MWGSREPDAACGPRTQTLFRYMWGLLLGSAEKLAALTSMNATGGHGPDSDKWWEHLFLLRVERKPLLSLLAADQAEKRQKVVRLCLQRCLGGFESAVRAAASADCEEVELVRGGNCGVTLATLFFHMLHVRRMTYMQTIQLWDRSYFSSLLDTLLLALRAGQPVGLQASAVEILLTIATADPNLSSNTTFGMILDFAAPMATALGEKQQDVVGFGTALIGLLGRGASIAGKRTTGSSSSYCSMELQSLCSEVTMLVAVAAHYQRGETQNSFVRVLQQLGPQDAVVLRGAASMIATGLSGWLASVRAVAMSAKASELDALGGAWEYLSQTMAGLFWTVPSDLSNASASSTLLQLPAVKSAGGGDGKGVDLCMLPPILFMLYELLYRNSEPFCRISFEVDKEKLREQRQTKRDHAPKESKSEYPPESGERDSAPRSLQSADGGLLGELLPALLGVCSALFVENGRRADDGLSQPAAGTVLHFAGAMDGAVELCLNTCLCLVDDRFVQTKLLFDADGIVAGALGPTCLFGRDADNKQLIYDEDAFGKDWPLGDRLLSVGLLAVQHCRLPRPGAPGSAAELGRRLSPLGKALGLIHRLLCMKKSATSRRSSISNASVELNEAQKSSDGDSSLSGVGFQKWDGLWEALIRLLGKLVQDDMQVGYDGWELTAGLGAAVVTVWAQLLNLLNLAVTYGHQLLPTAEHYDRLLYELLRAQPAFARLHREATKLAKSSRDPSITAAASVVLRPLTNVVSIANQIGKGLDATLDPDELLPLIATARKSLQLRLLPDLDRFEAYSEGAAAPATQRRLVNNLVASAATRLAFKNRQA